MVVGKDAYLRRAFSNPDYLSKKDGITVQRGDEIVQKEGCCIYPGENLVGGWCRVTFIRSGEERTAFKEVSLAEYNKGMANWKSKPATMINKVAISQCVREAFPKDYEGLYSEDEMVASGAIQADYTLMPDQDNGEDMTPISQEQRKALFAMAHERYGKDKGNELIQAIMVEFSLESTTNMPSSTYVKFLDRIMEVIEGDQTPEEGEGDPNEKEPEG